MKLTPAQSSLTSSMTAGATAVEAFLRQSPAFDGGEVRLWNHRQQRLSATVKWMQVGTSFGFHVRQRVNVFYDRHLAELAREIQMREFLREVMRQEMAMTHAN